tara:strand:- start:1914 stop:2672 length:759 start_codon:yes stop_codon:yes gene_type:complete
MIGGKFYTVEVKPTVAASAQHEGAFAAGDVVFDWTAFEIPKTTAKLVGLTILVRPQGNSGPTTNSDPYHFLFAKSDTISLGTPHANPDHRPTNDILGLAQITTASYTNDTLNSTAVGMALSGTGDDETPGLPFCLTPNLNVAGCTEGYGTLYVGGIVRDSSLDFSSILVVNDADIASAAHTTIVTGGTGMDNREHFLAGDVIHAQDDAVVGTLASVAESAITLTSELGTSVLTNGDTLYNIHPIRLILQFEI